jgi:hypothetical protein
MNVSASLMHTFPSTVRGMGHVVVTKIKYQPLFHAVNMQKTQQRRRKRDMSDPLSAGSTQRTRLCHASYALKPDINLSTFQRYLCPSLPWEVAAAVFGHSRASRKDAQSGHRNQFGYRKEGKTNLR